MHFIFFILTNNADNYHQVKLKIEFHYVPENNARAVSATCLLKLLLPGNLL